MSGRPEGDSRDTGATHQARGMILNSLRVLGALLMLAIVMLMFVQVIARFVFESPYPWAEEVARYSYVWMVLVSSVVVAAERTHISVHLFEKRLSARYRRTINAAAQAIVAASCFVLAAGSFGWLNDVSAGASAALGIPNVMLYGIVWACILGMGIYFSVNAFHSARGRDSRDEKGLVEEVLEEGAGG